MKSPILAIPVVLQIALIVALYASSSVTPVPFPSDSARNAEMRQLLQQRDEIEARRAALESSPKAYVPRGIGGFVAHVPAKSIGALSPNIQTRSEKD